MRAHVLAPSSRPLGSVVRGHVPVVPVRARAVHAGATRFRFSDVAPGPPARHLAAAIREPMAALFGASFASVQIEPEGAPPGTLATTRGERIRFAPGAYRPHTTDGRRLIAHELAHVLQQRAGRVRGVGFVSSHALEAEADAAGTAAAEGRPVHIDAPATPAAAGQGPIQPALRLRGNPGTQATNLARLNGLLAGSNMTVGMVGTDGVVAFNPGAVSDPGHSGYRLVQRLIAHHATVHIGFDHLHGDVTRGSDFNADRLWVHMNVLPTRETVRDAHGNLIRQDLNPSVVLGHELAHADRHLRGTSANPQFRYPVRVHGHVGGGLPDFDQHEWINAEEAQTVGHVPGPLPAHAHDITENQLRASLGILPRLGYNLDPRMAMIQGIGQEIMQHHQAAGHAHAALTFHGQQAAWHGGTLAGHIATFQHYTNLATQAGAEAAAHAQQRDFHGQQLIDENTEARHVAPHAAQMRFHGSQMAAAQQRSQQATAMAQAAQQAHAAALQAQAQHQGQQALWQQAHATATAAHQQALQRMAILGTRLRP